MHFASLVSVCERNDVKNKAISLTHDFIAKPLFVIVVTVYSNITVAFCNQLIFSNQYYWLPNERRVLECDVPPKTAQPNGYLELHHSVKLAKCSNTLQSSFCITGQEFFLRTCV